MVIDFSHRLWCAARKFLLSAEGDQEVAQRFSQRWYSAAKLEVNRCTKEIDADFAASIAFKIGQLYAKGSLGPSLLPEEIANRLLAELETDGGRDWFDFAIGGGGYINVGLKDSGKDEFVQLVSRAPALLFSEEQLVNNDSREPIEIEVTITSQWDNPLIRARECSNEELIEFVSILDENDSCSFEDFLIILICLDDSNRDIVPYRSGLSGSQNVPWYLDRFFRDVRFCANIYRKDKFINLSCCEIESKYLSHVALRGRDLIAEFRFVLIQSLRSTRPEILLSYILRIVKEFYKFYNHPETRSLLLAYEKEGVCSQQLLFFSRQSYLFEEIVSKSLTKLSTFYGMTVKKS